MVKTKKVKCKENFNSQMICRNAQIQKTKVFQDKKIRSQKKFPFLKINKHVLKPKPINQNSAIKYNPIILTYSNSLST